MLSKKTKYGLKALAFLATKELREPVQIAEIASEENIPQKFLESILLSLRKTGFLGSKKGKGGGYYLIKDPSEIQMTSVIRVLEGPIAMVPCVSLNFYEKCDDCPDENTCAVHKLMIQVRDSALNVYRKNTLADIIIDPKIIKSKRS
ncbi:MAG: Rrf2 family transcriptional regulator [Flavobacteriaceae bacterium]